MQGIKKFDKVGLRLLGWDFVFPANRFDDCLTRGGLSKYLPDHRAQWIQSEDGVELPRSASHRNDDGFAGDLPCD